MLLYWLFGELLLQTLSHPTQPYRFQTALSHSTLLECCALGQFYEFHLVVIRYPIRTLLYIILAIVVACGCKSSGAPQWCSKYYTEIPRIIVIQLYKKCTLIVLCSIHIKNYRKTQLNLYNHSSITIH